MTNYPKFFAVVNFKGNKTKKISGLDSSSTASEFIYDYPSCLSVDLYITDIDGNGENTFLRDNCINHDRQK